MTIGTPLIEVTADVAAALDAQVVGAQAEQEGHRHDLDEPHRRGLGDEALAAPVLHGAERHRGIAPDDEKEHHPAEPDRQVLGHDRQHGVALDPDRPALADHLEQDALQTPGSRTSVTTNDGMPTRDTRTPLTRPISRTGGEAGEDAEPPRHVVLGGDDAEHGARDTGREAGGQVDLADQQHEDQAHRDDDDGCALDEEVREVERVREGVRPERGEDDDEDDQAQDGRERADVAAAQPRDVLAEGVGQGHLRKLRDVGGLVGRAHAWAPVPLVPGSSSSGSSVASATATCPASSTSEPPVMSLTTSEWLTSLASTCAVILPR